MIRCRVSAVLLVFLLVQQGWSQTREGSVDGPASEVWRSILERPSLTDGFFGLNDYLADYGLEVALGLTQVAQQNVHGGLSSDEQDGHYTGSYDLEVGADTARLLGREGGSIFMLAEGSWPKAEGVGPGSVGSFFGVNGDAGGERAMDVTELWYQQDVWGDALQVRAGKVDLTSGFACSGMPSSFDGNLYANDENTQFLNGALVNNPTIPFPDNGLGVMAQWQPVGCTYVAAGVQDGQADARETGLGTAFHDEDWFFYIAEAGVVVGQDRRAGALPGTYRVGLWLDGQEKQRYGSGRLKRDDVGWYVSCEQMVWCEPSDEGGTGASGGGGEQAEDEAESGEGLAVFGRYGWADEEVNELGKFWSVGVSYKGLVPGRDDDVMAFGVAQGIFSDKADEFREDAETACELYYRAVVMGSVALSPSVQYIASPGGQGTSDAVVVGARLEMIF